MAESEARSDEQKAQDYSAMLGSVSVITNCLDDDNNRPACRLPRGEGRRAAA